MTMRRMDPVREGLVDTLGKPVYVVLQDRKDKDIVGIRRFRTGEAGFRWLAKNQGRLIATLIECGDAHAYADIAAFRDGIGEFGEPEAP